MLDPITVEISRIDLIDSRCPEATILERLRQAGIPVKGVLSFRGVVSGKLTSAVALDQDLVRYEYTDCEAVL